MPVDGHARRLVRVPGGGLDGTERGTRGEGRRVAFDRRLEVAARYGQWDPTSAEGDLRREVGAAVNWYHNAHALKVQSDLRRLTDDARGTTDTELRIQAQFAF